MRKRTLYLETSIFGFLFDERPENEEKKESVQKLLEQVKQGLFEGVSSALTVLELEKAQLDYLLEDYKIRVVELEREELENISQEYISAGLLSNAFGEDAEHVAAASMMRVDALVSLNLKHIANTWRVRGFNAVNLRLGYPQLDVATPQEVIIDVG